jgi:tryptophan-rich sensory protein
MKIEGLNLKRLFLSLFLPFTAGFIGSVFTFPAISSWYEGLKKPSFSPPNFVFGPVWTILYLLMGVSFYLILQNKENKGKKEAVYIFIIQLFLNTSWSISFFGLKNPLLGAFVIIALWFLIVLMIIKFYRINKISGLLNIPYLIWVSFASVLNIAVYALNM